MLFFFGFKSFTELVELKCRADLRNNVFSKEQSVSLKAMQWQVRRCYVHFRQLGNILGIGGQQRHDIAKLPLNFMPEFSYFSLTGSMKNVWSTSLSMADKFHPPRTGRVITSTSLINCPACTVVLPCRIPVIMVAACKIEKFLQSIMTLYGNSMSISLKWLEDVTCWLSCEYQ